MGAEYLGSRVTHSPSFSVCAMLNFWFRLLLPDLTPNSGLWWYFFTEVFDHFRPFFLMVFSVGDLSPKILSESLIPCNEVTYSHIRCSIMHKVPVSLLPSL